MCKNVQWVQYINPLAPNRRICKSYHTAKLQTLHFKYLLNLLNTLNMLHILLFLFSSRCSLFHNAIFFGSCNIHILNTGCAKILKKITAPKG